MNELWQAQQALLREAWEYKLKMLEAMDNPPEKEKYRNLLKSKQFEAALLYPEMNEETLGSAMCLVDSNFCWELFVKICEKYELSPKVFTLGLKDAWTIGVGTGDPKAIEYFRKVDGRLMMDEKEQLYFDALPDEVTIYRGCNIKELNYLKKKGNTSCLGISWTTDRGVAEFFAFRVGNRDRVVVSAVVKKSSIITFINNRDEYECIFLDIFSINPQIVTQEPTKYYDEYMRKKNGE